MVYCVEMLSPQCADDSIGVHGTTALFGQVRRGFCLTPLAIHRLISFCARVAPCYLFRKRLSCLHHRVNIGFVSSPAMFCSHPVLFRIRIVAFLSCPFTLIPSAMFQALLILLILVQQLVVL